MKKNRISNDLFAGDVPLVDGIIEQVVMLRDEAKVYFTTDSGSKAVFTFHQTLSVWDRRSVGQEIGGMGTLPIQYCGLLLRERLLNDLNAGELDQQTLDDASVYSFINSWSEEPILEIVAAEMTISS